MNVFRTAAFGLLVETRGSVHLCIQPLFLAHWWWTNMTKNDKHAEDNLDNSGVPGERGEVHPAVSSAHWASNGLKENQSVSFFDVSRSCTTSTEQQRRLRQRWATREIELCGRREIKLGELKPSRRVKATAAITWWVWSSKIWPNYDQLTRRNHAGRFWSEQNFRKKKRPKNCWVKSVKQKLTVIKRKHLKGQTSAFFFLVGQTSAAL